MKRTWHGHYLDLLTMSNNNPVAMCLRRLMTGSTKLSKVCLGSESLSVIKLQRVACVKIVVAIIN